MKLEFIALDKLFVSKCNMRYARKAPDVSDILPTVRARGVIQSILVRPDAKQEGEEVRFEIVAGFRRFHAAQIVAAERLAAHCAAGEPDPEESMLPCAILDDADDASAIEASLIENMARLEPDEVSRWTSFTRLIREGRSIGEIAQTFGLPELGVKRILALGNLLPRIREMYRAGDIDAATVRHLTLASKSQQKAWLALVDDPDAYEPRGTHLRAWLFGGQSASTGHALFDVEASGLIVVADLFGEDAYFADGQAFWLLQNAAIEAKRAAYIDAGWADAQVLPPDSYFHSWEHEKTPKRKGGRVYLDVRADGEVVIHEGYLSRKEVARLAKAEGSGVDGQAAAKVERPELTSITQTYVDLHRYAAVRAAMLKSQGVALRLMVAHAIAGSPLWRIVPEPQAVKSETVQMSIHDSWAEAVFDEQRRAVLALLNLPGDEPTLIGGSGYGMRGSERPLCGLFSCLLELGDAEVMQVLTLVMGEALAAGSPVVEKVGIEIGLDMAKWWEADEAFLETLRDREVLLAMVGEVAGPQIAAANAGEKAKTLRAIIRDHLAGAGGRTKREGWVPRWMTFPPSAYTGRGGVGSVAAYARAVKECRSGPLDNAQDETQPETEGEARQETQRETQGAPGLAEGAKPEDMAADAGADEASVDLEEAPRIGQIQAPSGEHEADGALGQANRLAA